MPSNVAGKQSPLAMSMSCKSLPAKHSRSAVWPPIATDGQLPTRALASKRRNKGAEALPLACRRPIIALSLFHQPLMISLLLPECGAWATTTSMRRKGASMASNSNVGSDSTTATCSVVNLKAVVPFTK